jgi:hypothetical protein
MDPGWNRTFVPVGIAATRGSGGRSRGVKLASWWSVPAVLGVVLWSPGVTLASGVAPLSPAVDANSAGQAVVAWARPDGVRALMSDRATGATVAATLASNPRVTAPLVAIDERGEALVVWETYRLVGGGECSACGPRTVSDGVYAAIGHVGSAFAQPFRVAEPRADTGADVQLANPVLAMEAAGRAIVAGSDAAGTWVASHAPGAGLTALERAATDFTVTGAALGRDGEVLLADTRSRVVSRPAGSAFGAPVALPGADTPYGPGALVAANAAGDAVALYRGSGRVLASRRTSDGAWGTPATLTTVGGAAGRAIAVGGDGTAVAGFAHTSDGAHTTLIAATLRTDGTTASKQLNAAGTDGDMLAGALDTDASGRFAVAYRQAPTLLANGDALVTTRPPDGDFTPATTLTTGDLQMGNVARIAVSAERVLAVWTVHANPNDELRARWLPDGATVTLDWAPAFDRTPPVIAPHVLQFTTQPVRRPDRRGRILVALRCWSSNRSSCTGTLRLTAGPHRWTAGRKRYAIGPNLVLRTRVQLTTRARRALRRQGRLTLTARGVPGRIVVRPAR